VQFTATKIIAAVVADVPAQRHACPQFTCITTATSGVSNGTAAAASAAVLQQQQPVCAEEVIRFVLADTACTLQQSISCNTTTAVTSGSSSAQRADTKTMCTAALKTLASAQVQDFSTLMWVPLLHSAAVEIKGELSETNHASSTSTSSSSSSSRSSSSGSVRDSTVSVAVAVDGAAVTVGAQALQALTWCSTVIKGLAVQPEFRSYRIINRFVSI
jgi:hypothetical protein